MRKLTKSYLKDLVYRVNGAAIEVHKTLGPGLLESVYHRCLEHELRLRNIAFVSEKQLEVIYKDMLVKTDFRCDLFVENCLPVELKAVESIKPIFEAQMFTQMNLTMTPLGLMLNFNVCNLFKDGQKTYVNDLYRLLPE